MQFEDTRINTKIKLAALWTSLMFFIIYIDYFHLYMPGMLTDIQNGKAYVFDITQGFLTAALTMIGAPALMIFLSIAMPASINRKVNIIVALINIPLLLFNLAGLAWIHMIVGAFIEIVLLFFIIYYAYKWPRFSK